MARMSSAEIEGELASLPEWRYEGERLRRRFTFGDFPAAFAFMTRCAFAAEKMDHHPDWTNVYNKVDVVLWTHDAGGITKKDFALARAMEAVK